MAPKRTAESVKAKARPAKVSKTEEAEAPSIPPPFPLFQDHVDVVVTALNDIDTLSNSCREMLQAAAPHCFRTAKEDRHAFQASTVDTITALFSAKESAHAEAVKALEAQVAELKDTEVATAAEFEEAKTLAASRKVEQGATASSYKESTAAVEEAKKGLSAARQKEASLAGETKALEEQKAEIQTMLSETWEDLVKCKYPGKEWRKRDRAIAQVAEMLQRVGAPGSLVDSVSAALKTKEGTRGKFAEQALVFGKAALADEVAAVTGKIENQDAEAKARAAGVAEAEAAVCAAEAKESAALDTSMAADNAWADAETCVKELKAKLGNFAPQAKELWKELDAAKASLAAMCEVNSKLKTLREHTATSVQPVAPGAGDVEGTTDASVGAMFAAAQ